MLYHQTCLTRRKYVPASSVPEFKVKLLEPLTWVKGYMAIPLLSYEEVSFSLYSVPCICN